MQGHDVVSRVLDAEGVGTVFTLMSEDTMRLMATIEEEWEGIDLLKTRHEQGAVAMADGFARATDDIGVCLVGRGPAVAQTGTAMVTARKNGSDLLAIVPEPPLGDAYDIKAFDQEGYLRSTLGSVTSIRSPDTLAASFREVIRRVRVGDGPLAVGIPWDVLDGPVDAPEPLDGPTASPDSGMAGPSDGTVHPAPERVEAAVDMYVDSAAFQPPVILAGRGAVRADAREAIERLAERTSALLATSLKGRDYFADHPFHLGVTGAWGSDTANRYASESHLVVAVGASLNPYTTDEGHVFGEDTRVIHVDRDPVQPGRHTAVDLAVHGDARVTVEALLDELDRRGIDRDGELWTDDLRREIAEASTMNDRDFPDEPGTVDPRALVRALDDLLPAKRKLVTDGGHFTRWVVDGLHSHPADFTFTLDFASIGLGLPMGIGTARAAPEHTAIAVCGDAGLLMSVQELETAARNDVPVLVVVWNDESLGSEYHSLDAHNVPPEVAFVDAPEFADVAESVGAAGYTVRSLDDLRALSDTLAADPDGPVVIDCKVNPYVRHRSKM